jgi:peptidoglycan/LPS O-acetylase OafA/YrhL
MDAGSLSKLVALAVSLAVALLALWLITRPERRRPPHVRRLRRVMPCVCARADASRAPAIAG